MGGLAGRVREYVRLNGISYTARRAVEKFPRPVSAGSTTGCTGGCGPPLRTWNSSAIGPGRKRR